MKLSKARIKKLLIEEIQKLQEELDVVYGDDGKPRFVSKLKKDNWLARDVARAQAASQGKKTSKSTLDLPIQPYARKTKTDKYRSKIIDMERPKGMKKDKAGWEIGLKGKFEESLDEGSPGFGLPDPEVHMLKAQLEKLNVEMKMLKQHLLNYTTHCKCMPKD